MARALLCIFAEAFLLAFPCYLAWYHATVAYEKVLSGMPSANAEFQKMWAEAERVCNDESGNNSPPAKLPHTPSPSGNNKTPASSPPSSDSYNSNSPPAAPPSTAPHSAQAETNKMPPLAPQRSGSNSPEKNANPEPYRSNAANGGPIKNKVPSLIPQSPDSAASDKYKPSELKGPHFIKSGRASEEFVRKLEAALNAIPDRLRALVRGKGFKMYAVHMISESYPRFANEQARGHDTGEKLGDLFGFTNPDPRDPFVVIAEYKNAPTNAGPTVHYMPIENKDPGETLRHEFGHAVDNALNKFSSSPVFQRAYAKDIDKFFAEGSKSARQRLKYYTPDQANGTPHSPQSELFAEMFAIKLGGGQNKETKIDDDLVKYFPNVSLLVDQTIKQLTKT